MDGYEPLGSAGRRTRAGELLARLNVPQRLWGLPHRVWLDSAGRPFFGLDGQTRLAQAWSVPIPDSAEHMQYPSILARHR